MWFPTLPELIILAVIFYFFYFIANKISANKINNEPEQKEISNESQIKPWNPIFLAISPLIWILWEYPQINAESKMLQIAEASAGAVIGLFFALLIPTIIFIFKKIKKSKYVNFTKHAFIGTIIVFTLIFLGELNHKRQVDELNYKRQVNIKLEKLEKLEKSMQDSNNEIAKLCKEQLERLDIQLDILESEYRTAKDNIKGNNMYYFELYQMKKSEAENLLFVYLEAKNECHDYMKETPYTQDPIDKLKNMSKGY